RTQFIRFLIHHSTPRCTLLPYPTLFRSLKDDTNPNRARAAFSPPTNRGMALFGDLPGFDPFLELPGIEPGQVTKQRHATVGRRTDRKSTRLNSSHVKISYAVFCWKKKKT